ncbi:MULTISPECIES: MFS transporter [unclassified Pseudoalteromonas]|uniref:MFS transporter n=1 Tax=unclassified Pseudoalteromonas TaxID=194690 RepID=UPI0030155A78
MSQMRLATWFLLLASTLTVMASAPLAPALPGMTAAFTGVSEAAFWTKMTLALPGLVIAICAPLVGSWVDRLPAYLLLRSGLVAFIISAALGYYWQFSLWLLLLSRAFMGFAVALIMVAGTTLAGKYLSGEKFSQFIGMQAAFGGFGGVFFMALAGFLAQQHWSWVFAIYALALFILPGAWMWIKDPKSAAPTAPSDAPHYGLNSSFVGCCGLAFVEVLVLYGLTLYLPFYLTSLSASASDIGLIVAMFLLAMSVSSLCYGQLRRLLNVGQAHVAGWLLVALGFVLLSFTTTLTTVILTSLVVGIGLGAIRPNLVVWLFAVIPLAMRGKAMGIMTTCYFTGQFLSPVMFDPIIAWLGYQGFFLCLGTVIVSITVLFSITFLVRKKAALAELS